MFCKVISNTSAQVRPVVAWSVPQQYFIVIFASCVILRARVCTGIYVPTFVFVENVKTPRHKTEPHISKVRVTMIFRPGAKRDNIIPHDLY